jgi:DNA processing protein
LPEKTSQKTWLKTMTRREALVALNMVLEIGSLRLNNLLAAFATPQQVLDAPLERLIALSGIDQQIAGKIKALQAKEIAAELVLAEKMGLRILTREDAEYPENLQNIPGAPLVLYLKGELIPEDRFSISMVGSRHASFYGLSCAEKFSFELSAKGFTIVSGMARGVDTASHRGALKAGGRTIAVMGSGFAEIYPAENKRLAEEIAANGAVISEFPIHTPPWRQNFPRRNRLISGLSLGVVVVEAARNSGALITADFALEQGREVFALPGAVNSRTSFGTNELIKQGAKLVTALEDILEEINLRALPANLYRHNEPLTRGVKAEAIPDPGFASSLRSLQSPSAPCSDGMGPEELLLYNTISSQPITLDELSEKTNLEIPRISDILLRLEMRCFIRQLPGKQFIRSGHV